MYQYLRQLFASSGKRTVNSHQLQRTISGIDEKRIVSGSYLYKIWIKTNNIPKNLLKNLLKNCGNPSTSIRLPDYVWRYHTLVCSMAYREQSVKIMKERKIKIK